LRAETLTSVAQPKSDASAAALRRTREHPATCSSRINELNAYA
jgi:hypothetical protein